MKPLSGPVRGKKRSLWRTIARNCSEGPASLLHCANRRLQTETGGCHCCVMGISTGPRWQHTDPGGPIPWQPRQFSVRPAVTNRPNGALPPGGKRLAPIPLRFRAQAGTSTGIHIPAMPPLSARLVASGGAALFPMHACVVFTTAQSKSANNSCPDVDQFLSLIYIACWSNFLDNRG